MIKTDIAEAESHHITSHKISCDLVSLKNAFSLTVFDVHRLYSIVVVILNFKKVGHIVVAQDTHVVQNAADKNDVH